MKKTRTRLWSLLLTVAMLLTLLPATALAEDTEGYSMTLTTSDSVISVVQGESVDCFINETVFKNSIKLEGMIFKKYKVTARDYKITYRPADGGDAYEEFASGIVSWTNATVNFDFAQQPEFPVGTYTVKVSGALSGEIITEVSAANAVVGETFTVSSETTFTLKVTEQPKLITDLAVTVNGGEDMTIDYAAVGGHSVDIPVAVKNQDGEDVTAQCQVNLTMEDKPTVEDVSLQLRTDGYVYQIFPYSIGQMEDTTISFEAVYEELSASDTINLHFTNQQVAAEAVVSDGEKEEYFSSLANAIAAAQDGDTVTLLKDVTLTEPLVIDKDLTLDLNQKTLTSTFSMTSDASGEARFALITKADVTIQNGTYISDPSDTSAADTRGIGQYAGDLTLKNLTAESVGPNVCNYAAVGKLTISDCTIAGDYAVGSWANNSTVDIDDSTLNGTVCGLYHNGSYGGLVMRVNDTIIGGSHTGEGEDPADDPTGVYISGSATSCADGHYQQVTLTNCEITGSSGVEVKYTDLTIQGAGTVITATGDPVQEELNSNGSVTTGYAVASTHNGTIGKNDKVTPDASNGPITIKDGAFTGLIGIQKPLDKQTQATISISGGTFSSDPTAYLADGYTTAKGDGDLYRVGLPVTVTFNSNGGSDVASETLPYSARVEKPADPTKSGYSFAGWYLDGELYDFDNMVLEDIELVAKWNEITEVVPPEGVKDIQISTGGTEIDQNIPDGAGDILEALKENHGVDQAGTGITDAAQAVAADSSVINEEVVAAAKEAGLNVEDGITIVVETYLEVKVTAAAEGSFTLDITPMYQLKASDGNETKEIGKAQELTVTGSVELTIPLPQSIADITDLFVHHEKNGVTYVYDGTRSSNSNLLTFTNPHGFSAFTVTNEGPVAMIEGESYGYTDFQDAVDAVKSGQTIIVYKDGLSATVSGNKVFYVTLGDGATEYPTLTAADGYVLVDDGEGTYTVYKQSTSSGGTAPVRDITVDSGSHGDVEVWPEEAKQGTTVTITATPDKGYEVAEVVVTDENGTEITVTDKGDGKYTFTMPNGDVTIEVSFRQSGSGSASGGDLTITAPAGWVNPYTDVAANAWYYNAVGYASANGLMGGVGNNAFAPSGTMNRAMVWTVIARLAGQTISGESWAADAQAWAVAQGVSDGTNPDGAVSREELVTMLYRYAGSPAMNVPELGLIGNYPDSAAVSAWAQNAFAWAISQGIIEGRDGKLAAGDSITRAEAATILARFHLLTK